MSAIDLPEDTAPTLAPEQALSAPWARVRLALMALAVDPAGLGGLWLRARCGPVRDSVTAALSALPLPLRRLHPSLGDEALFGGLDLTATLAEGRQMRTDGLLARPSVLVLAMAERCPAGLAARLAQALDDPKHCLVALDEGAEAEEALPGALADRLALFLSLDDIALAEAVPLALDMDQIATARARFLRLRVPPRAAVTLTGVAASLGIGSLRAPLLALRLARVIAALRGHAGVRREDVTTAAELVFAHRATRWPETAEDQPPPPAPEAENEGDGDSDGESRPDQGDIPEELVLEAVRAALPEALLDQLAIARAARATGGATGSGEARPGHSHGRPLSARPGRPSAGLRLDLIATLRAAAPWQGMRRKTALQERLVHIRPSDLRIRRYQERNERVLIFAVDASGSAALARLAEAKGAVELLLARAYARRDHVALIAFRGAGAELILPPTRSLVQTKRRLAGLPGGGGTPLAAALQMAQDTAVRARAKGLTPVLALLTDGRANVALDGTPGRARTEAEAEAAAKAWRRAGFAGVVIDTANRPQDGLRQLSLTLGAAYLPLPRATAERLSSALEAALVPMQAG
jgi:magnesium chelatase subunit D